MSLLKIYQCDICQIAEEIYEGVSLAFYPIPVQRGKFLLRDLKESEQLHICTPCAITLRKELNRKRVGEVTE